MEPCLQHPRRPLPTVFMTSALPDPVPDAGGQGGAPRDVVAVHPLLARVGEVGDDHVGAVGGPDHLPRRGPEPRQAPGPAVLGGTAAFRRARRDAGGHTDEARVPAARRESKPAATGRRRPRGRSRTGPRACSPAGRRAPRRCGADVPARTVLDASRGAASARPPGTSAASSSEAATGRPAVALVVVLGRRCVVATTCRGSRAGGWAGARGVVPSFGPGTVTCPLRTADRSMLVRDVAPPPRGHRCARVLDMSCVTPATRLGGRLGARVRSGHADATTSRRGREVVACEERWACSAAVSPR